MESTYDTLLINKIEFIVNGLIVLDDDKTIELLTFYFKEESQEIAIKKFKERIEAGGKHIILGSYKLELSTKEGEVLFQTEGMPFTKYLRIIDEMLIKSNEWAEVNSLI